MLLDAANGQLALKSAQTKCGMALRDHIKECTTPSTNEAHLSGELCPETEMLYSRAKASYFVIPPLTRTGWTLIYGYDDSKVNLMSFNLAHMLPEERKALCRMILSMIHQMVTEHERGALQSAPKFLGLLSKGSYFNLWFEAGVPIVALLKNPDQYIKALGNLAFVKCLKLLELWAEKHSRITTQFFIGFM